MAGDRGPYAKGRKRRKAILRATVDLFSQFGSRKVSMGAIAADVGISPALLQYYFPTREDLLVAVIVQWDEDNDSRQTSLSHFARWLEVVRHNMAIPGLVHLYMTCVVEATDPDHPGRPFYEERYARLTREITTEIRRLQEIGTTPLDVDVERVARALLAGIEGIQIRWLHDPTFDMYSDFLFLLEQFSIVPPDLVVDKRAGRQRTIEG